MLKTLSCQQGKQMPELLMCIADAWKPKFYMVMIGFENYFSISSQILPNPQNEIALMIVACTIRFQINNYISQKGFSD